nr:uncharacterized protein LOC117222245 [Megalopta genalis]
MIRLCMFQTITIVLGVSPALAWKDRSQRCLVGRYTVGSVLINTGIVLEIVEFLNGCLDINRATPLCIMKLTPTVWKINAGRVLA